MADNSSFLSVNGASRHFGGHKAVDDVSFELGEGSLAAVIGPNGAGKTTLFNLIAGALPLTSGRITFQGKPMLHPEAACALGVARTFQNVRLFREMTVLENIMAAMGGIDFTRGSLPLSRPWHQERLRMKRAFYLLEDVGLGDLAGRMAGDIPFGQQRLVEIARALALKPRLLLLDEPAAGLNATETDALGAWIRRIHQNNVSILLVEHDMTLVMNTVTRLLVLDRGRLIFDGDPAGARKDARVCSAYLGAEA